MKNLQLKLFLIILLITYNAFAWTEIEFSPLTQHIYNVNSGEEIIVYVDVNAYGNNPYAYANFNIEPINYDEGFISVTPTGFAMLPGEYGDLDFKFQKTVTSNEIVEYKFIAHTILSNGDFVDFELIIFVHYVAPECNLITTNTTTTNIDVNSARLNWNFVSGNSGYDIHIRKDGDSTGNNYNSNVHFLNVSALEENTVYKWIVRVKCTNGVYGSYTTWKYFTTLPSCQENLTITQNVNTGQTDIKESSNIITATNTIFSGATAEYDAGTTVFLKPNFHAKQGSNFRAYIEGCQSAKSGKKSIIAEETISIKKDIIDYDKFIKVYPNPTNNRLTIESSEEISSWVITNSFGKSYFRGNSSKNIEMYNLPNGIYFLKAILIDGKVISKTIIKK